MSCNLIEPRQFLSGACDCHYCLERSLQHILELNKNSIQMILPCYSQNAHARIRILYPTQMALSQTLAEFRTNPSKENVRWARELKDEIMNSEGIVGARTYRPSCRIENCYCHLRTLSKMLAKKYHQTQLVNDAIIAAEDAVHAAYKTRNNAQDTLDELNTYALEEENLKQFKWNAENDHGSETMRLMRAAMAFNAENDNGSETMRLMRVAMAFAERMKQVKDATDAFHAAKVVMADKLNVLRRLYE